MSTADSESVSSKGTSSLSLIVVVVVSCCVFFDNPFDVAPFVESIGIIVSVLVSIWPCPCSCPWPIHRLRLLSLSLMLSSQIEGASSAIHIQNQSIKFKVIKASQLK